MQRNFFAAFRLSEPGTAARCLPGDRNSSCRLPALHRVCRKPPQDGRALPELPADLTSRAHREAGQRAPPRRLPKDAARPAALTTSVRRARIAAPLLQLARPLEIVLQLAGDFLSHVGARDRKSTRLNSSHL